MTSDETIIEPLPPPTVVVVPLKPFWHSATVWLNVFGIVAAVITGLLELDFIKSSMSVGTLGVLNVLLRVFHTRSPVTVMGRITAPTT